MHMKCHRYPERAGFWPWTMAKRIRRRKCRNCGELYYPDHRNRKKQRYCSKADCRAASKKASNLKWRQKEENRDYFSGPHQGSMGTGLHYCISASLALRAITGTACRAPTHDVEGNIKNRKSVPIVFK